jgi:predicted nucleic acid-binding protein
MPDEVVLDASVAAKVFIEEEGSRAAEALVLSGVRLVAPEFVLVELANVAVKRLRRGHFPRVAAERMIAASQTMFDELVPSNDLFQRAFTLACDHGLSTYDAMYVALAEARGCEMVSADLRLISRAAQAGLAVTIRAP